MKRFPPSPESLAAMNPSFTHVGLTLLSCFCGEESHLSWRQDTFGMVFLLLEHLSWGGARPATGAKKLIASVYGDCVI